MYNELFTNPEYKKHIRGESYIVKYKVNDVWLIYKQIKTSYYAALCVAQKAVRKEKTDAKIIKAKRQYKNTFTFIEGDTILYSDYKAYKENRRRLKLEYKKQNQLILQ